MANEADILSAESLTVADQTVAGGTPFSILRSKRKRAYHRALKRGEAWAKINYAVKMMSDSNVNEMYAYYISNNAWDEIICKSPSWNAEITGLEKMLNKI